MLHVHESPQKDRSTRNCVSDSLRLFNYADERDSETLFPFVVIDPST